jgi:hypothetical protein
MRTILVALGWCAAVCAQTAAPKDLQLFLLVGQSNMAGRGAVGAEDKQPIPHVWMLTEKQEWVPAVDPMHYDKPAVIGVGIGRSFARELAAAAPGVEIGLIPAAFGGSALDEWAADGKHYPNAIARAKAAMKSGTLRGILWHQGEADSSKEELARSYRERFAKLVARFRKDLDAPEVPVVVGQLGPFFKAPFVDTVNEQLATAPLMVERCGFAASGGLVHKGDNVHFDTPSLYELGRRYALAFRALDRAWGGGQR